MKKLFLLILLFISMCTIPAWALPGPYPGQDTEAAVEAALGGGIDIMAFAKVDSPAGSNGGLSLTYDGGAPSTTGSWDSGGMAIAYISLKAANEFLVFDVGGISSGLWSTEPGFFYGVNSPGILNDNQKPQALSHLTAWKTVSSVAEPATLALFGLGLIALAGVSRKRFAKRI